MFWYMRLCFCRSYKKNKLDVAQEYKKILKNKELNHSSDEEDRNPDEMLASIMQSEQVRQKFYTDH